MRIGLPQIRQIAGRPGFSSAAVSGTAGLLRGSRRSGGAHRSTPPYQEATAGAWAISLSTVSVAAASADESGCRVGRPPADQ